MHISDKNIAETLPDSFFEEFCALYREGADAGDAEATYRFYLYAYPKYPEAMYRVGVCREKGKGCERNIELALEAYLDAAEAGNSDAKKALERLKRETDEFREIIKKADELDPDAQYELGRCYEYGLRGADIDTEYAFRMYVAAESGGSESAAFRLGYMYENGKGTQMRPSKAFEMYKKAAESALSRPRLYLAYCYDKGIGTKIDSKKAHDIYLNLADEGSLPAKYMISRRVESGEYTDDGAYAVYREFSGDRIDTTPEEVDEYIDDSDAGDSHAQFCLAMLYEKQTDMENSDDFAYEALEYYAYAAKCGFAPAKYRLGMMYSTGYGVEKDESRALSLFAEAADAGFAPAGYEAGKLIESESPDQAAYYYELGANNKYAPAMLRLSLMYETGKGVKKNNGIAYMYAERARKFAGMLRERKEYFITDFDTDIEESYYAALYFEISNSDKAQSISLYEKCAEEGFIPAIFRLALLYEKGTDELLQDTKKAFELLRRAAKSDHSEAMYRLGVFYRDGIYLNPDRQRAFELFTNASLLDNASGKVALAEFYENGICTLPNRSEALELYREAARLGNDTARERFEEHMRSIKKLSIIIHTAKNGDLQSQYSLAMAYLTGTDIAQNEDEGYKWMERAAKGGFADAAYYLARSYEEGIHYRADIRKARSMYKAASEAGHIEARKRYEILHSFGRIYSCYLSVIKNRELAKPFLQKLSGDIRRCAEEENGIAMYLYAVFLETSNDSTENYDEATEWYRRAAFRKQKYAMYETAERVLAGRTDFTVDVFEYYRLTEKEIPGSAYRMGYCYEMGIGRPQNLNMAIWWYEKAAQAGEIRAIFHLAKCYEFGRGCEKDIKKAEEMYEKTADSLPLAAYRLALIRLGREDTQADAMLLMRNASYNGCTYAMVQCGMWSMEGYKCLKSETSAFNLFMKAAEERNLMAQYLAAVCMERGLGTPKSYEKAEAMYKKAAGRNHSAAKYRLYKLLSGETDQRENAEKYLQASAKAGYAPAVQEYMRGRDTDECFTELIGITRDEAADLVTGSRDALGLYRLSLCCESGLGMQKNIPLALRLCATAADAGCAEAMQHIYQQIITGRVAYDGDEANRWFLLIHFAKTGGMSFSSSCDVT